MPSGSELQIQAYKHAGKSRPFMTKPEEILDVNQTNSTTIASKPVQSNCSTLVAGHLWV